MAKIKRKNTRPKISFSMLWQNLLTFAIAQLLALATAIPLLSEKVYTSYSAPVPWYYFVVSLAIATMFVILAIKYLKGGRFFVLVFYFVIVLGAMEVFANYMTTELAIACALIILVLRITAPRIWTHNLAIIMGLAGVSASIGLDLMPLGVVIILVVLSIYDYIAVYKTKTMVKMFEGMMSRGVIFSIIIPQHAKNWFTDLKKVKRNEGFMFLGTGDIALPMLFAAACLNISMISAIAVIIGATVGVLAIHLSLAISAKRAPMPALPPIALFSILGFLISLYL
ncbi:MAG: presenilin family intramembrane aspartyl protease [Patescibacteria group bacterium]